LSTRRIVLANRLNAEPCIFRGCSSTELGLIVIAAILFWLPVNTLIAWFLGKPAMGLGLAGIAIVATVVIAASVMQGLKRGRPDGYFRQAVALKLDRLGLKRSSFICRDGDWSLGRTQHIGVK
jgi:conjugative transfer region protein (TIGR03750 family)